MGSTRYDTTRLSKLIENCINEDDAYAKSELDPMIISGEDLVDALEEVNFNYKKLEEEYENLEEKYNKLKGDITERTNILISNLESLVKGRQGPLVDKINFFIKEYNLIR